MRPALFALGFLVVGIIAGTFDLSLPIYILLLLLGFCVCGVLNKKYRYFPVFFFMLFLLAGLWRGGSRMEIPVTPAGEVVLFGRVTDVSALTAGGNRRVIGKFTHEGNNFLLAVYLRPHLQTVKIGQDITVTGEIIPLSRAVNPGGYDAFLHLRTMKVDAVIWPTEITTGEINTNFLTTLRQFRDRLAAVFDATLPPREAGIIRSMVLGDREDLHHDLTEIYRVAGIRHILSISGLHITIITLVLNLLLGKLINPRKAGLATLFIMILYCLMTGAAMATVRAVTMGGILVFAKVLYRDYDLLTSISWACIALLLYEPLMLFNVGFQLSFGAVYGIAILTAPLERLLTLAKIPAFGRFRNGLAVSAAATFSTYIVLAHHFYEIPLYSILANVIIIPFVVVLLVLGIVTGFVGLLWLPAAALPGSGVFYILQFYEWVSRFFGSLPFAMVRTGGGSIIVSLAGVLVLLLFAYMMHGFGAEIKRRLPLMLFGVAALMLCVFLRDYPLRSQITELDTTGNYVVERYKNTVTVTGNGRGGERDLLRYLDKRGVNRACSLTLTDWPRPADIERIIPLFDRIRVLYIPASERLLPEALTQAARVARVEIILI
jgi:competence protein ComEC